MSHTPDCGCGCHPPSRRDFLKTSAAWMSGVPLAVSGLTGDAAHLREMAASTTVQSGKAQRITLLHTADIHSQLNTHDEFFWENGQAVYKKRGGFAVLKTMLHKLRAENPAHTLLIDGGDCFQGGGVASLTEGQALVPLINNIGYDLILPGNWEVVYGKKRMQQDLGGYHAQKICANMFHDTQDAWKGELMFPPYWTKMIGGIKIGFVGYNDPLTPRRQSPAYSRGIRFAKPEENVAKYIRLLRDYEGCAMVFLVTHMGLAQQLDLANQAYCEGADFVLGADTHERVRTPIQGKYAKVTEPGAFGSFVAKLDLIIENGKVKDTNYQLLDVDPSRYKPDPEMLGLIDQAYMPYKAELQKVVGKSKRPLVRYFVIETPMDNFITDALMEATQVDIVISNGFRFCPPIVPHPKKGEVEITNDHLWSIIPVNAELKRGEVTGKQLWDWLEVELNNVFAKDPTKRFGGWLVRFQGMEINFTIGKEKGQRLNWIKVGGASIDLAKTYTIAACERDGDPDDTLCRIEKVQNPRKTGQMLHDVLRAYLAKHSPIAPKIEGRATATDADANLLTQLEGYDYQFR